jgi:hypothetical protein
MKNIVALTLLTTGFVSSSIISITSPASADQASDEQRRIINKTNSTNETNKRTQDNINYRNNNTYTPSPASGKSPSNYSPSNRPSSGSSGGGSYTPSSSNDSVSDVNMGAALGGILGLVGVGAISSNGDTAYGVYTNLKTGDSHLRVGIFLGEKPNMNMGVTYGVANIAGIIEPFIGAGFGAKGGKKTENFSGFITTTDTINMSLYGTAGVDLNLGILGVSGLVNVPVSSAYGTDYQVGLKFNF